MFQSPKKNCYHAIDTPIRHSVYFFIFDVLFSANPVTVTLTYKVVHATSKAEDSGLVQGNVQIDIDAGPPNTTDGKAREDLLKMLKGEPSNPVLFQYILPKFLKVTNRGTITPVEDLMVESPGKYTCDALFQCFILIYYPFLSSCSLCRSSYVII